MARLALLLSLVAVGLAAVALFGSLSSDPPDLAAPPAPRDDSMADEARDRAIETLAREINKLRRERAGDAAVRASAAIAPAAEEPAAAASPAEEISELAPEVLLLRLRAITGKGGEPDRAVRLADELLARDLAGPLRTDVLIQKAIALRGKKQYRDAEVVLRDALAAAEPNSSAAAWAMCLIAWGRAEEKEYRTAAEWMDQAASQSGATDYIRLDARVRAAQFLLQDGDRAGARERIAPVIEDYRDAVPPGLEIPITQARNLWRQLGE